MDRVLAYEERQAIFSMAVVSFMVKFAWVDCPG